MHSTVRKVVVAISGKKCQTEEGEARRDDENFSYVAAWEYQGEGTAELHKEQLDFEIVKPSQRSYK